MDGIVAERPDVRAHRAPERRELRVLLARPGFRLLALPAGLAAEYEAHRRALARRNIQRFWPLVLLASVGAIPMAIVSGVVKPETLGVILFGVAGLAVPIAIVVVGNVRARLEPHSPRLDVVAAALGLTSMHALTMITEDLPTHRSIAEHAVILVTLATCTIANLSFRSAVGVCVFSLGCALAGSSVTELAPDWTLFPFYAVGSIVVGSIAGVTAEIRERTVYLQERLLALEKRELDLLSRELAAMSREDALTRLPNRRHFDEVFAREWAICRRERAPLGLLFIDVDHFKRFNDLYGHPAGDECLRRVAGALAAQALRGSDLVARYGGEELVGVFPRTDEAGVQAVARRFIEAVDALAIPHQGSETAPHVTISIGVVCDVPSFERDELLSRADAALYRAKAAGRHRFEVAGGRAPDEASPDPAGAAPSASS